MEIFLVLLLNLAIESKNFEDEDENDDEEEAEIGASGRKCKMMNVECSSASCFRPRDSLSAKDQVSCFGSMGSHTK